MAKPPRGHMFSIGLNREQHEKIFSSATIRPRALIFGKKYHLVDLYQVCSNYSPWVINGPALGVTCLTWAYIGSNMKKIFLSETTRPRALIICM